MIDHTDFSSDAVAAWITALLARGVTLQARGKNVGFAPKSAYNGTLTNAERAFYRAHKAEIVALLRERYSGTAGPSVQAAALTTSEGAAPTSVPAPEPAPLCKWCNRSPCIGPEHPAFADLHPEAQPKPTYDLARLRTEGITAKEAITPGTSAPDDETDVMMKQIGKPLPAWWWT